MTWWHRLWRRKKIEEELEKELRFVFILRFSPFKSMCCRERQLSNWRAFSCIIGFEFQMI